jgi:ribosomal protein L11 methyltransferase
MDQFKPMQFAKRTFIVPWDHEIPEQANIKNAAIIRLDPGLAFGSGTHPTTALCLEWLDAANLHGKQVLDFGCGSGILAIAALKLGASHAVGVDNDPQAIIATQDNAERNAVADQLQVCLATEEIPRTYPIVVANILASALLQLANLLASRVEPNGLIALSGILRGQEQELLQRYAEWFVDLHCEFKEDWVRITGRRMS